MIAICHKCGETKPDATGQCASCGVEPRSDDDFVESVLLTDKFLTPDQLAECAELLRCGQDVQFPPDLRAALKASLRASRKNQSTSEPLGLLGWAIVAGIIGFLFLIFHPWPHYQWASFRDNVSSYERFVNHCSSSDYADSARQRIRVLQEPAAWSDASSCNQIEALRDYVRLYHDGSHLDEAKTQIAALADIQWYRMSDSRSETEIRKFLSSYPETTKVADAEGRIQELSKDWDWVREQDTLEHYQRFAAQFPSHPQSDWIAKRIIDLEVKEIAAGEYGEMPRAQPLTFGGSTTKVEVENKTGYELTVRYSGPDSKKLVIPKGMTRTVSMNPGSYKVAASVDASNVQNYYGSDEMKGGQYSSNFYIETEFGGFSMPNYSSRKSEKNSNNGER